MREAAQLALTEWNGGIQQGRRIIDAEAYKRRWKESQADNARLREALEFYARDGWTGPCAYPFIPWIMEDKGAKARAALHPGEGETADPCDGCAYNNGDAALLANCVGCLEFDDRPHRVEAGPNAPVHWWEAKTTDKKE
jgi:hypothetical protein